MKKLITIILGAGVSHNYDFPLGSELVKLVQDILPKELDYCHQGDFATINHAFAKKIVSEIPFVQAGIDLAEDMTIPIKSIDTYINKFSKPSHEKLDDYARYSFILKSAIALRISKHEQNNVNIKNDTEKIYAFLFKKLFSKKKQRTLGIIKLLISIMIVHLTT